MGGEAIIRFSAGPVFSGDTTDFFTPSNWRTLDLGDLDISGTGPVLIDVPGATPSALIVALGKNGVAYLIDRNDFGGIGTGDGTHGEGVTSERVATGTIINAAAAYTTGSGTYVVFTTTGQGVGCPGLIGNLVALQIGASAPPTISVAWCANNQGRGSPIVTTPDGSTDPVVWTVGSESSNRLHAFDGETGTLLFSGGGPGEQMTLVRRFQTPIAVDGRIFVAADNQLYAFTTQ
jgi:outer membrane protein assembly factor BamB